MNEMVQKSGTSSSGDWLEGRVLGKYKLLEHIGSGAFASIYKAVHLHLPIYYAIKVLHPAFADHEEVVERFFREAQASSQLQHKNIVFIADFAVEEDIGPYIVMEYLEGETLAERLKRLGALPLEEVGEIGYQVCLALDLVHKKGIVHRDLKPDNIFLIPRELGRLQVKILDFGIAHLEKANESITGVRLLGTPIYMAPEQFEGVIQESSLDLYAFGIILFEMLTGKPPYQGRNMHQLGIEHLLQKIPELDAEKFPEALRDLQRELLAKDPAERPQEMNEVHERLVEAIDPERAFEHWHVSFAPSREMPQISLGNPDASTVFEQVRPTLQIDSYSRVEVTEPDVQAPVLKTLPGVELPAPLQQEKNALQDLLPRTITPEELPQPLALEQGGTLPSIPDEVIERYQPPTSIDIQAPALAPPVVEETAQEGTDPRIPVTSPEFAPRAPIGSVSATPIEVVRSESTNISPPPTGMDEPTLQRLDDESAEELEAMLEESELLEEADVESGGDEEDEEYVFSEEELRAIQDEAEMLVEEEDIFATHSDTVLYTMPVEEKSPLSKVLEAVSVVWKTPLQWFDELRDQMTPKERKFLLFVWLAVALSISFSLLWILIEMATNGS